MNMKITYFHHQSHRVFDSLTNNEFKQYHDNPRKWFYDLLYNDLLRVFEDLNK